MSKPPERTALHLLYSTSEEAGLPEFLDRLYPKYMPSLRYMGTAWSCPNGGPGVRYGHWDFDEIEKVRVIEWGTPETPVPTALYRLRNKRRELLYVGVSNDLAWRWRSHAADKEWWPQVATRSIEWFPTRSHALAAEALAIRAEQPLHNVHHNKREAQQL
ncbi:GIY-YIG nuclease family protein [Streptomyces huasconensis]|uniref:GIY-YIG nuclease family protein n=1 Tax=Streptomyces huasconensis TaxID=1854574 RepID=UPI0036F9B793